MIEAIVLGSLQGMLEWLPVSSEGVVAAVYAFSFDKPLDEAIGLPTKKTAQLALRTQQIIAHESGIPISGTWSHRS